MSDPNDPIRYSASVLISQDFIHTPSLKALVDDTKPVKAIDVVHFDAIVVAGDQAPMFTSDKATGLQSDSSDSILRAR
jgi:hypothetical protein